MSVICSYPSRSGRGREGRAGVGFIKEETHGNQREEKPWRIVINQQVSEEKARLARNMRRNMTPAEAVLWQRLRNGALGVHFRRQQVIRGFIADFYCHQAALVVEADGAVHDPAYDAERDRIFAGRGITVMRFTNQEVLEETARVMAEIRRRLGPTPVATRRPLPEREGWE